MKKLRNLGEKSNKQTPIIEPEIIHTNKGIIDYIPTFNENNLVQILSKFAKHSKSLQLISNCKCVVDYCKVSDLGDIVVETLYLKNNISNIANPYLVEHFKLCK